jgi:probable HAF family extracellular repeat protein
MCKWFHRIFALSLLTLSLFLVSLPAAAQVYLIEDLGTLGRDFFTQANGINDYGDVVGCSTRADGQTHAFLYTDADGMVDLGTLPGGHLSCGRAVNNLGQVVGYSTPNFRATCPVLWTDGRPQLLPTGLDEPCTIEDSNSEALDINDAGQIMIKTYRGGGSYWNFRREPDGRLTGLNLDVSGINQYGQVAGTTYFVEILAHRYTDEVGREFLGTLGGEGSDASGINDWGQVVGSSATPDGNWHAFRYTDEVGMEDLGILPGYPSSRALAINNQGVVVGFVSLATTHRAFVYTDEEGIQNLNDLIDDPNWVLSEARDINDAGQIVGVGTYKRQSRAFRLTPMEFR